MPKNEAKVKSIYEKMVLTPTTTSITLLLVSKSLFLCMCKTLDCNWSRKSTQGAAIAVNMK